MLRVLFDNCVPYDLRYEFGEGIEATEARAEGLGEADNGKLLKEAHARGYNALLSVDTDYGRMDSSKYPIPVLLLRAFPDLLLPPLTDLAPEVEGALLRGLAPGLYVWDIYEGESFFFRSFAESEELRERLKRGSRRGIHGR